jgi:hypothetical protein
MKSAFASMLINVIKCKILSSVSYPELGLENKKARKVLATKPLLIQQTPKIYP